jgi:hypothetical protein
MSKGKIKTNKNSTIKEYYNLIEKLPREKGES